MALTTINHSQGGHGLLSPSEKGKRALTQSEKGQAKLRKRAIVLLIKTGLKGVFYMSEKGLLEITVTKGIFNPKQGSKGQKGYPCPPFIVYFSQSYPLYRMVMGLSVRQSYDT